MQADAVKLDEVSEIEVGAEGIRVTWHNGERKFIRGEIGFELYQQWMELNGDGNEQQTSNATTGG